ncbi:ketopantoate reductase family protein [uncultured Kushneria sp.]|uniref:ketopantoate reductase family protein n=1 Tax=uncultured Kushneria sp. TaxID=905033 RepID=UPI00260F265D|nr:2-dehydropantoate 2-reductase [uncultured Kushneria sp.]
MQIAIMGAGAIGSYYGALLARAGHAVTLIGRAAHVEAIHHKGLMLETASGRETFEVTASTSVSACIEGRRAGAFLRQIHGYRNRRCSDGPGAV